MNIPPFSGLKDTSPQSPEQVLTALQIDLARGLSSDEARKRLKQYGLTFSPHIKRQFGGKNWYSILKVR